MSSDQPGGSRIGAGLRIPAFLLDSVSLVVVASVGGVRLGVRYQQLLGGDLRISQLINGGSREFFEARIETAAEELVVSACRRTLIYRFIVKFSGTGVIILGMLLYNYVIISIGSLISAVIILGAFAMFGPDHRCLHDYVAGTAVLRRKEI